MDFSNSQVEIYWTLQLKAHEHCGSLEMAMWWLHRLILNREDAPWKANFLVVVPILISLCTWLGLDTNNKHLKFKIMFQFLLNHVKSLLLEKAMKLVLIVIQMVEVKLSTTQHHSIRLLIIYYFTNRIKVFFDHQHPIYSSKSWPPNSIQASSLASGFNSRECLSKMEFKKNERTRTEALAFDLSSKL